MRGIRFPRDRGQTVTRAATVLQQKSPRAPRRVDSAWSCPVSFHPTRHARSIHRLLFALVCLALVPRPVTAAAEGADYLRDVKPLLKERCYACHGALKQKANLRLDTAAGARKGGDNGPAVEPGKGAESLLVERVASGDPDTRMPPEGAPLTAPQIGLLQA